jgi:fatty-acid peroxygenase
VHDWEARGEVVLFDEVQRILTRATCSWAGVPIEDHEMAARARDFGLMIDAFGGVGPRLWKGKLARARTERWMKEAVERARSTSGSERPESALAVMSGHRDLKGRLLPARVAAVELINVIRPTVAVSWFIAFAALALHEHPAAREQLAREGAGSFADLFMQEVRRYYPCTHYLGARVRQPFVWRGHRFGTGTLVVLDVYGTDHDPRLWDAPDEFRPSRFEGWPGDPFSFIPQGGGSRTVGHRCPGEWITMHNTALALHFLTRGMVYEIAPGQDLRIDRGRMPTRPASGVVVRHVRALEALDRPAPPLPSTFAVRGASAEARGGGEGRS